MGSLYQPLDKARHEIRLLELAQHDDGTACYRLHVTSIDENPTFTALSYVWGDPNVTKDIIIDGYKLAITTNLASALRHVKSHWQKAFPDRDPSEFRLWADAICINQPDISERNHQVPLMRSIYSSAELVIAWLSGEDGDLPLAFKTLEYLHEEFSSVDWDLTALCDDLEWIRRHPGLYCEDDPNEKLGQTSKTWSSLESLCFLVYWRRVWILQEVLLAKHLLYTCPSGIISSGILEESTHFLGVMQSSSLRHRAKPDYMDHLSWMNLTLPGVMPWGGMRRIKDCRELLHASSVTLTKAQESFLKAAFFRLVAGLDATDPRDFIYGLLAVTRFNIDPDYDKPVWAVYGEYISVYSKHARDLGDPHLPFLTLAGTDPIKSNIDLPSWAPNYAEYARGNRAVFAAIEGASASHGVFKTAIQDIVVSKRLLAVSGVRLQKVVGSGPVIGKKGVRQAYGHFVSASPQYITGIPTAQAMFRTMFLCIDYSLDRDTLALVFGHLETVFEDGKIDLKDYGERLGRKFFANLRMDTSNKCLERLTDCFFPDSLVAGEDPYTLFQSYGFKEADLYDGTSRACLQLVRNGVLSDNLETNPRLFGTDDGYIGLTRRNTGPGDFVCIIQGHDRPVILRDNGDGVLFVGECFVLGFMEGEAKQFIDSGRSHVETFNIR